MFKPKTTISGRLEISSGEPTWYPLWVFAYARKAV